MRTSDMCKHGITCSCLHPSMWDSRISTLHRPIYNTTGTHSCVCSCRRSRYPNRQYLTSELPHYSPCDMYSYSTMNGSTFIGPNLPQQTVRPVTSHLSCICGQQSHMSICSRGSLCVCRLHNDNIEELSKVAITKSGSNGIHFDINNKSINTSTKNNGNCSHGKTNSGNNSYIMNNKNNIGGVNSDITNSKTNHIGSGDVQINPHGNNILKKPISQFSPSLNSTYPQSKPCSIQKKLPKSSPPCINTNIINQLFQLLQRTIEDICISSSGDSKTVNATDLRTLIVSTIPKEIFSCNGQADSTETLEMIAQKGDEYGVGMGQLPDLRCVFEDNKYIYNTLYTCKKKHVTETNQEQLVLRVNTSTMTKLFSGIYFGSDRVVAVSQILQYIANTIVDIDICLVCSKCSYNVKVERSVKTSIIQGPKTFIIHMEQANTQGDIRVTLDAGPIDKPVNFYDIISGQDSTKKQYVLVAALFHKSSHFTVAGRCTHVDGFMYHNSHKLKHYLQADKLAAKTENHRLVSVWYRRSDCLSPNHDKKVAGLVYQDNNCYVNALITCMAYVNIWSQPPSKSHF